MGYLTKYGSVWGQIPLTHGQVFWVAPGASYVVDGITYTATDDNDGLSPARAKLTVADAITDATANVGDVIVLLPGAHTGTSTITISKSGLTLTGLPSHHPTMAVRGNAGPKKHRTTITNTGTAGIIFTISAGVDDTEIAFLHLLPTAAGGRGVYAAAAASGAGANRVYIHDCTFAMVGTASTSTYGIQLGSLATGSVNDMLVRNCFFQSGDASTTGANGGAVVTVGTAYGLVIENSSFAALGTGAWARAIEGVSAGSRGVFIRDCDFLNSAGSTSIITTAIYNGATTDGNMHVYRCYIPQGTDTATSGDNADIILAETYLASSAGGALATNA